MDDQQPQPPSQPTGSDEEPTVLFESSTKVLTGPNAMLGRFGDYDLLEVIATGGMGVVYKARQRGLNRIVALKMIKAGQFAGQEEIARFHTEAEAAANLRHPHIVTVHEVGQEQGRHYFSMAYIKGESLKQRVARGPLEPDQAAEMVRLVAQAIHHAHQKGILHRDLKASNVMLDAAGRPKVTDFGLAKRLDGDSGLTTPGEILGTPSYMAPEQAAGKNDQIGPATDVYALGGLLYELLTAAPPFEESTPLETVLAVIENEPRPPRLIDVTIPRDLETVCLKCLAKDPAQRYTTAEDLADDLQRFLHAEPVLARPLGASGDTSRLAWYMIGAIVFATLFAWLAPERAATLKLGGDIFLSVLKMIVVPLVMASVMNGILTLGDVRRLGRAGGYTILYYMATTLLAVLTGLLLVNLIQPGAGALSAEQAEMAGLSATESLSPEAQQTRTVGGAFEKLVRLLFSDNLFRAMADGDLLPLILFSIVFAAMLTTMGRRAETVTRLIVGVNHALMNFVLLLMKVAPIGIFCLVAAQFGQAMSDDAFLDNLSGLALYMLTVIGGLGIHFFVSLPLILYLATRRNPLRFLRRMSEALLTAFSTASSSATLPVSMECAVKRAGVSRRSAEFVLPLGSTINMDGTALYEAVAVLFIAQGLGMSMTPVQQITIVITATLAAIGAAGIPHAGLVTLVIVLHAVGLPLGGIGIILTVDVILDRFRTATNVFGDAVGAAVVEKAFRASS